MRRLSAFLTAVAGSTAMLAALAAAPPAPAVSAAWARATTPAAPVGAVYLVIDNASGKADRLLSVSTDRAERSEVHTIVHDGDLMKMRRVDPLHVGAGQRLVFEPGGTHVMLMGLTSPLVAGESLVLVMNFEMAGTRRIKAQVVAATVAPSQSLSGHHP